MVHLVECWLCSGRGERQIALKPHGEPDGRRVCRVCVRRLIAWIRDTSDAGRRPETLGGVWLLEPSAPADPDVAAASRAFVENVAARLPASDDSTRARAALALLEMGLVRDALGAAAAVDPSVVEAESIPDPLLGSLLWRLLDRPLLRPDARERLQAALYPSG